MKSSRREFLRQMGLIGFGGLTIPKWDPGIEKELVSAFNATHSDPAADISSNEDLWKLVRASYQVPDGFINLENGYFSAQPIPVMETFLQETRKINTTTSYFMRRERIQEKERIRNEIAHFAGFDPEEVALTRNTTESLDILIAGIDLKKEDEVIVSQFDYGSMLEALQQREERDGIVLKTVPLPIIPKSNEEITKLFEDLISEKTRLILVTQLINLNGQILPARELCEMGRKYGIEVIVDAAHAFAHLPEKPGQLGADLYGTSLHKWLSAPLGNGLLKVTKEKIDKIWPLMGDRTMPKDSIRKFEHQGTRPPAAWLSISKAIQFQQMIGLENKAARLDLLKRRWAEEVKEVKGINLNTSLVKGHSAAIAHVSVDGYSSKELMNALLEEFGIWTVAVDRGPLHGVRITPNIYNTLEEVDALTRALKILAK